MSTNNQINQDRLFENIAWLARLSRARRERLIARFAIDDLGLDAEPRREHWSVRLIGGMLTGWGAR